MVLYVLSRLPRRVFAIGIMNALPAVSMAMCHDGNVMVSNRNKEREGGNGVRRVRNVYNDGANVAYCRLEHDALKAERRVFSLFLSGKPCTDYEILLYNTGIQVFVLARVFMACFVLRRFDFKIIGSQSVIVNQSIT